LGTHLFSIRPIGAVIAVCIAVSVPAKSQDLLTILNEELKRNFEGLKQKADPPPYFISYAVTDEEAESMSATLGALATKQRNEGRVLDVGVRVGSAQFDSSRRLNGDGMAHTTFSALLPFDGQPNAVRQRIWLETDRSYHANTLVEHSADRPAQYEVPGYYRRHQHHADQPHVSRHAGGACQGI
jgi:hypothetical protein